MSLKALLEQHATCRDTATVPVPLGILRDIASTGVSMSESAPESSSKKSDAKAANPAKQKTKITVTAAMKAAILKGVEAGADSAKAWAESTGLTPDEIKATVEAMDSAGEVKRIKSRPLIVVMPEAKDADGNGANGSSGEPDESGNDEQPDKIDPPQPSTSMEEHDAFGNRLV